MIFQIHIPKPPLNEFIDCFIYQEDYNPEHLIDRFLPNGNVEIVIDLEDLPKYIYDNETLKEIQSCHQVWASGVRTNYITIHSGKGSKLFITIFKKGKAYPFFPFPMNEIKDTVVDADLLWGMDFAYLRERILAVKEITRKFGIVEDFFLKKFRSKFSVNNCVEYAVQEIIKNPQHLTLGKLSREIGYSQKHFIELFRNYIGITPKAYLQIMRFQKIIHTIGNASNVDWAAVAQDCGFYDQAHFNHNFKRFSGLTPETYFAKSKSEFLDYVPVG